MALASAESLRVILKITPTTKSVMPALGVTEENIESGSDVNSRRVSFPCLCGDIHVLRCRPTLGNVCLGRWDIEMVHGFSYRFWSYSDERFSPTECQ